MNKNLDLEGIEKQFFFFYSVYIVWWVSLNKL